MPRRHPADQLALKSLFRIALPLALALAAPADARILPETLLLPQCEFYPLREQDRGFLHRYTDLPLFVDPDLPEDGPHPKFEKRRHRYWGEWFSQADWDRAEALGKDFGFVVACLRPAAERHEDGVLPRPPPESLFRPNLRIERRNAQASGIPLFTLHRYPCARLFSRRPRVSSRLSFGISAFGFPAFLASRPACQVPSRRSS